MEYGKKCIIIGDGGDYFSEPLTALDYIAHEYGHAVTSSSANLHYINESGAIDEGISDIWAACIDNYVNVGKNCWVIGEDVRIIRDMSHPLFNSQPTTYQGYLWQDYRTDTTDHGGVHNNSGVMNYWFYLLSEGGSGRNDNRYFYDVQGIGMQKAAQIVYLALTSYFTSRTDYPDAARLTRDAAIELYGSCSEEVRSVIDAWHAVGVSVTSDMLENITLSGVIQNDGTVRTNRSITLSIDQPSPRNTSFIAGESIHLLPGTHIRAGSYFHASIEPCYTITNNSPYYAPMLETTIEEPIEDENHTFKQDSKFSVSISPNPVHDVLTIEGCESYAPELTIHSMHGQIVLRTIGTSADVSALPNGIYLLTCNDNGHITQHKFIKQ